MPHPQAKQFEDLDRFGDDINQGIEELNEVELHNQLTTTVNMTSFNEYNTFRLNRSLQLHQKHKTHLTASSAGYRYHPVEPSSSPLLTP